jgi:hypothetical protein
MAKYTIEYSCGHTDVIQLYGKTSERESYLEWARENKLCPDCYQAARQQVREVAVAQAAQENAEFGLPSLKGTDKQITWAETIRKEKAPLITAAVNCYDTKIKQAEEDPSIAERMTLAFQKDGFDDIDHAFSCAREAANAILGETSAHWWIDHRDDNIGQLLVNKAKEIANTCRDSTPAALDAKAEATVRPESPVTETVAEIQILEKAIEIIFPEKRDDFREIVRFKLGYSWDKIKSRWTRTLSLKSGSVTDRAAELGNKLLAAGFPVRIFDESIRTRAISGTYEPECHRWIMKRTANQYAGWFSISWPRDEDFFKAAKKLPGSKYDKPDVVVPPEQFEQVLDFAEIYGFKLSLGALEAVETARTAKDAALTARVEEREEGSLPEPGKKPRKLVVPENVEVDDEFKD